MHDESLVYWSARASGVAFFAAAMLAGQRLRGRPVGAAMRVVWTISCVLLVVHELLALGVSFGWNQSLARRRIAEQTLAVTGVDFGGGLAVNYIAAIVWTADVAWWWLAPASYLRRPRWIGVGLWTFLAGMFFFGAVVFAAGWTRTVAAAMFAVAFGWISTALRCNQRPVECSAST